MAIHGMGYFCDVMRLYADEWKLMFLCPNQLGHYIMYFHSTLKSFATSHLSYILWIAILATYQSEKLHSLQVIGSYCFQTKSTPKKIV